MSKQSTIYAFCLVSAVIILGAISLNYNLSPLFDLVDKQIEDGRTIVMNGDIDSSELDSLLIKGDILKILKTLDLSVNGIKIKLNQENHWRILAPLMENGSEFRLIL